MQSNPTPLSNDARLSTYAAPGITVNVRVNGQQCTVSSEARARCLVWREGNIIDSSIDGLVVRRAHSGRVVSKGFHGYDAVIAAYERGELGKGVKHA